jgi:DNA-binding CsgD family transcriptional regulator
VVNGLPAIKWLQTYLFLYIYTIVLKCHFFILILHSRKHFRSVSVEYTQMKKERSFRNYYGEYLDVCSSVSNANVILDLRKLLKKENSERSLNQPFGTCLIDYSGMVLSYISDHCHEILSYSKDEYEEGGIDFYAQTFHPGDKVIFSGQVFRDIREYWNRIPSEEISNYRFSFTHRYFRKDGTESQMLEQNTYLEPNYSGIPVLNLLTFTDIGDFKTDTNLVLTISRLVNGQGYVKIFSKSYPQPGNTVLSRRESEILRLCLDGLTGKLIAEKLFLSIQTVKNHKRNMMKKTSAGNITGLINLSIKNNWI